RTRRSVTRVSRSGGIGRPCRASKRVTYARAKADVSITTSMGTLIDVQNRCSRVNTTLALPRKTGPQVRAAREERLHPAPDGGPETLLGEELRTRAGGRRVEAPLERVELDERAGQRLRGRRLEEEPGVGREGLQRPAAREGDDRTAGGERLERR